MSTTYRFAVNVQPRQGWTEDDALAEAVRAVDAVTIVEHAEADHPAPGVWTLIVDLIGQGDAEARETARRTMKALQDAGLAADAPSLVTGRGALRRRLPLSPDFYPPVRPEDVPRDERGLLG